MTNLLDVSNTTHTEEQSVIATERCDIEKLKLLWEKPSSISRYEAEIIRAVAGLTKGIKE